MKYEVIMEEGAYALILRGTQMNEYAVVRELDKEKHCWASTCVYCSFEKCSCETKAGALSCILDYFRMKTEPGYIPRYRLEELATQFKDGLISDDPESAHEYFEEECGMTDEEKEFFGLESLGVSL